jgi:hypothetical protein
MRVVWRYSDGKKIMIRRQKVKNSGDSICSSENCIRVKSRNKSHAYVEYSTVILKPHGYISNATSYLMTNCQFDGLIVSGRARCRALTDKLTGRGFLTRSAPSATIEWERSDFLDKYLTTLDFDATVDGLEGRGNWIAHFSWERDRRTG